MGKIFVGQTAIEFIATVSQDITGATPVLIKYKKPSGVTGSWTATIQDAGNGIIRYQPTLATELDEDGTWIMWAHVTFQDGTIAAGEPFEQEIYNEGQTC